MYLCLICKAWRIHNIVIPTSTRISPILTKHSWSYLILDRFFFMQWTFFGMHLTKPPQKNRRLQRKPKRQIWTWICLQRHKINWGKKTPSAMASPPDKGNDYFLFWPVRDMSGCHIRSHWHSLTSFTVPHSECHDTAKAWAKLDVIQEC